jgi:hypothetical protein
MLGDMPPYHLGCRVLSRVAAATDRARSGRRVHVRSLAEIVTFVERLLSAGASGWNGSYWTSTCGHNQSSHLVSQSNRARTIAGHGRNTVVDLGEA